MIGRPVVGDLAWITSAVRDELLLFSAIGFALGGIDDLLIDVVWIMRRIWRRLTVYSIHPRATAAALPPSRTSGDIAVFIPAWREDAVIADMLRRCISQWGEGGYRLYVGCYANDETTIAAVESVQDPHMRLVVGTAHGPTTKAGCLNVLYQAMVADEARSCVHFAAVLLHDAEDLVHRDELRVHAALGDRFSLIQLPVLPLRQPESRWVSGHYLDEFAEAHSRDMVVREAIGAALPSAGVGCSIRRAALADIAASRGGLPFAEDSLTEDYELGLRLGEMGLSGAFVRIAGDDGRIVATHAHFPATLAAAVRQKTRWTIGIALAGWDRVGWTGGLFERWMRLRDRRAPLAALLLLSGYSALMLTALLLTMWSDQRPLGPILGGLLLVNGILLLWRLLIRASCVTRHYGWREGLVSIPRMITSNIIAMMAARRAVSTYLRMLKTGQVHWDKTEHSFPKGPL